AGHSSGLGALPLSRRSCTASWRGCDCYRDTAGAKRPSAFSFRRAIRAVQRRDERPRGQKRAGIIMRVDELPARFCPPYVVRSVSFTRIHRSPCDQTRSKCALLPRDGDVAGKDGVPETAVGTKNGKLHGGILFVVKDRKKQRVPLKSRSAIDGDDIERHGRFFELVSDARD